MEKYFRNEYLELWIDEGILYAKYDDIVIDLMAAKKILNDRLAFTKDKSYPAFVDGRKVRYWTKEARTFQATKENNKGLKAAAMFIDSHAMKIIIRFYLFLNKPNIPQNVFTDEQEALKWLAKYKQS